jgi:dTDP-4-amino-4,6-dideoxygalactose transaminase
MQQQELQLKAKEVEIKERKMQADAALGADKLRLEERKIETKIHYMQPLHEISAYQQYPGPNMLSCSSILARRVISLPIYPELTDSEVEYIIDQVLDCVSQKHS